MFNIFIGYLYFFGELPIRTLCPFLDLDVHFFLILRAHCIQTLIMLQFSKEFLFYFTFLWTFLILLRKLLYL